MYDRLIPDAERHYAGMVADHLRIPIRYDVRDDETSITDWDQVSVHTPEPVDNPAAFAAGVKFSEQMATLARGVLLYGEGPDNALLYEWRPYLSHLLATQADRTPRPRAFERSVDASACASVVRFGRVLEPCGEGTDGWRSSRLA